MVFSVTLLLAAAVFFVATGLSLSRLLRFERTPSRPAHGAMAVGAALLLGALLAGFGVLGEASGGPLVLLFVTLVASGGVLLALHWGDAPLVGPVSAGFIGVVALALALHALTPGPVARGPLPLVTILHIAATLVGYLLLAPAFVLSLLYVGQAFRLKTKQGPNPRLPSLVTLERRAWRLLALGFVLLTAGIVGGIVTGASREASPEALLRPQHVMASVGWLIYAAALARRALTGSGGVRSASALIVGFVVTTGAVMLYVLR
jgi:ABC-type uncharacterized transport system permease subunit